MPNPLWRTLSRSLFGQLTPVSREEIFDLHTKLSAKYEEYKSSLEFYRPMLKKTPVELARIDRQYVDLQEEEHRISESLKEASSGSKKAENLEAQLASVQARIAAIPRDSNQVHEILKHTIATFPTNTEAALKLQKLLKSYVSAYEGKDRADVQALFRRIPQVDSIDTSTHETRRYSFEKNLKALLDGCEQILNLTLSDELKGEHSRDSSGSTASSDSEHHKPSQ